MKVNGVRMKKDFTKIQLIRYFLLQNRYVWKGLNPKQKIIIKKANLVHNNIRDDYADPTKYLNGKTYLSTEVRTSYFRGRMVKNICDKYEFENVLEVGPGAGFYTKTILNSGRVTRYTAIDIVDSFLDYIRKAISSDKTKSNISCSYLHGDVNMLKNDTRYDAIFILSTLHHIPNREEYLNSLLKFCHNDTLIVCVEPVHYILRLMKLFSRLKLYISDDYVYFNNYQNLSTHSFLTLNEFKSFRNFQVEEFNFGYIEKINNALNIKDNKNFILKYMSDEIFCVLKPKSTPRFS